MIPNTLRALFSQKQVLTKNLSEKTFFNNVSLLKTVSESYIRVKNENTTRYKIHLFNQNQVGRQTFRNSKTLLYEHVSIKEPQAISNFSNQLRTYCKNVKENSVSENLTDSIPCASSESTKGIFKGSPFILENSANILKSSYADLDIPKNVSLHNFIFSKCDEFANEVALEEFSSGRSMTYKELKENSLRLASSLHEKGLRKGDVIQVMQENEMDNIVLLLASSYLGLTYSAANIYYTPAELSRQLSDSGTIAVFVSTKLKETVSEALKKTDYPNKVKHVFVSGTTLENNSLRALMKSGTSDLPEVKIDPLTDIVMTPYTHGTQWLPKGVNLSHYNCVSSLMQLTALKSMNHCDRVLSFTPQFYVNGLVQSCLTPLCSGACLIVSPFKLTKLLMCFREKQISTSIVSPLVIKFLARAAQLRKINPCHLRDVVSVGGPLSLQLTQTFRHYYPNAKLNQAYGLSEMSGLVSVDTDDNSTSTGNLLPNTLLKVIDVVSGDVLGQGQLGEICVKGPQMMLGYTQTYGHTIIDKDGWLHTGDAGHFSDNGLIYITDRVPELLRVKNELISSRVIESILCTHPAIQDAGVIGLPGFDTSQSQAPKAFVRVRKGFAITHKELNAFCEEYLSDAQKLKGGVEIVETLPRSVHGKLLKRILRQGKIPF